MSEEEEIEEQTEYSEPEQKLRKYLLLKLNRAYKDTEGFDPKIFEEKSTEYLTALSDGLDLAEGREGLKTNKTDPSFFQGKVNNTQKGKKIKKKKNKKTEEISITILEAFDKRFTHNSRVAKFGKDAEVFRIYQGPNDRVGRLL